MIRWCLLLFAFLFVTGDNNPPVFDVRDDGGWHWDQCFGAALPSQAPQDFKLYPAGCLPTLSLTYDKSALSADLVIGMAREDGSRKLLRQRQIVETIG